MGEGLLALKLGVRRVCCLKSKPETVQKVAPGSIAEEAGIEPGDKILSINNKKIKDVFDYRYLIANEEFLIEVQKTNGEIWEVEIEKDEDEDLGIEFTTYLMNKATNCRNKCIFCFIDQLPKGLRETLYFKDDDMRLSFLTGNYVTLTNVTMQEIDRIVKYKLSPINISVHTMNPELRKRMLCNKFAGDIKDKIKRLIKGGISINCQIVLCREINDGKELNNTLKELSLFLPNLKSISLVPVGITKFRDGLEKLIPYDKESSKKVISQIQKWQKIFLEKCNSRIVYGADEFYIMADISIPEYNEYEDFPQIENGVGLIASFKNEFDNYIASNNLSLNDFKKISIATGVFSYNFIKGLSSQLEKLLNDKLCINVYCIQNNFFGKNITVTGLLTGTDLIEQLSGKDLGDELLISKCTLKAEEDIFLDNITVKELSEKLNTKVTIVPNNGSDFVEKILDKL